METSTSPESKNKKMMLMAGGGAIVVVIALVLLLRGGGDVDQSDPKLVCLSFFTALVDRDAQGMWEHLAAQVQEKYGSIEVFEGIVKAWGEDTDQHMKVSFSNYQLKVTKEKSDEIEVLVTYDVNIEDLTGQSKSGKAPLPGSATLVYFAASKSWKITQFKYLRLNEDPKWKPFGG